MTAAVGYSGIRVGLLTPHARSASGREAVVRVPGVEIGKRLARRARSGTRQGKLLNRRRLGAAAVTQMRRATGSGREK
jgi:hypothetical protein